MKLALFVHDFRLQIGHSNSLIELIRHLPDFRKNKIESITVVSYVSADLNDLFPEFKGRLHWHQVPLAKIQPSLLKSLFFQIWTYFYTSLVLGKDTYKIGIGICCMNVDAVSIQFIHHQWTSQGLKLEKGHFLRGLYKKILFGYYECCEKNLFKSNVIKFFTPAKFLENFFKSNYKESKCETIYSGINLERFKIPENKKEIFEDLCLKHPQLNGLDLNKPVYLFVGAYERKGLHLALEVLSPQNDSQFIVVGSPSFGRNLVWPKNIKIFPVSFSKEIEKFYAIADVFLFPTLYEPFGLVLFEAMAMGLTIITRKNEVGASELLEGLPEIYFMDQEAFQLPTINSKSQKEKKQLAEKRLNLVPDVSWSKAGMKLDQFLFEEP